MSEERKKWSLGKLKKATKESEAEFIKLGMELHHLIVRFGLRALKTFQHAKKEPLNPLQIGQIIEREIDNVIEDISKPDFIDTTIERTKKEWEKQQEGKG